MPKEVLGRAHSRLQTLLAGCGCPTTACQALCRVELACARQPARVQHTAPVCRSGRRMKASAVPSWQALPFAFYVSLVLAEADFGRLPWCSA